MKLCRPALPNSRMHGCYWSWKWSCLEGAKFRSFFSSLKVNFRTKKSADLAMVRVRELKFGTSSPLCNDAILPPSVLHSVVSNSSPHSPWHSWSAQSLRSLSPEASATTAAAAATATRKEEADVIPEEVRGRFGFRRGRKTLNSSLFSRRFNFQSGPLDVPLLYRVLDNSFSQGEDVLLKLLWLQEKCLAMCNLLNGDQPNFTASQCFI